jgi:putative transposase
MCATSRSWLAIGVNANGYRDVLGVVEGGKEDEASWKAFLRRLRQRGLTGVRLFISDKCLGKVKETERAKESLHYPSI